MHGKLQVYEVKCTSTNPLKNKMKKSWKNLNFEQGAIIVIGTIGIIISLGYIMCLLLVGNPNISS
jgi:hypothetical protein